MQTHTREPYKDVPMPGHIVSHTLVGGASGKLGSLVFVWECTRGCVPQPWWWAWGAPSGAPTPRHRYRAPAAAVRDICSPGPPCLIWRMRHSDSQPESLVHMLHTAVLGPGLTSPHLPGKHGRCVCCTNLLSAQSPRMSIRKTFSW